MKNRTTKIFIISFILLSFLMGGVVYAGNLKDAFKTKDTKIYTKYDPLDQTADKAGFNVDNPGDDPVSPIFAVVIQIALTLLGVTFILLLLYGGFLWITDQGNEEQVTKAKKIIISAVIGLVIVLGSYAISWFVINAFSQNSLEQGTINQN